MSNLTISEMAFGALPALQLSPNWFDEDFESSILNNVRFEQNENGKFVFTTSCTPDSKIVVISSSPKSLFDDVPHSERRQVFDRCVRLALRAFDPSVTINTKWMPYHTKNRVSVFAYSFFQGDRSDRIAAEVSTRGRSDVFIFGFADAAELHKLDEIDIDYHAYDCCRIAFDKLCAQSIKQQVVEIEGQIELDTFEENTIVQGFNYSDWYPNHLSKDQLKFVDHRLATPLRLRGAAGTGKTLAMVIKALKTKYEADATKIPKKILFITHSWAMAEHIDRLIAKIDINPSSQSKVDVVPLLYIANQRDYSKVGREPLGIDSEDGKKLALREISNVVNDFISSDWIAYKTDCSMDFVSRFQSDIGSKESRILCWDLLVEFGCVIAAQGILTHPSDKERYLRIKRYAWMMPLESTAEKEVVFSLWVRFMTTLRTKKWISSDQIISDYLNDLATFYWEAARSDEGYDIIFVDEMHLFNAQERLVFHNLLKEGGGVPLVVMALDPKQSPRETFTEFSDERDTKVEGIYERAKLPHSQKIDLMSVYRYTPEISKVIKSIHDAAPGLDLSEDWDIPQGVSNVQGGEKPAFAVFRNKSELFNRSIQIASEAAKEAWKRKGRVAILCMDGSNFEEYTNIVKARYASEMIVIASRDDTERLRYAGKKIVFSSPEYVAGLQFDTVVAIDANDNQIPDGKYRNFQLRRFLAELYLGFSRAQHRLYVLASKTDGGITKILEGAMRSGDLIQMK